VCYPLTVIGMPLIVRFALSVVVAVAVVCVPLCPPEHIHLAGLEGRTAALVHAHYQDGPHSRMDGPSLTHSHGDHGLAKFLTTAYDNLSPFALQPSALAGTSVVAPPVFAVLGAAHGDFVQLTHGPPRSPWLTRGPPSLL
jgi:hypothetical protein